MRKIILLTLIVLIPAGVVTGAYFFLRGTPPEWTARSPEALKAFEEGLGAWMKNYRAEAIEHFERAAELDQEMIGPKLYKAFFSHRTDRTLQAIHDDPERLNQLLPREQALLKIYIAFRADAETATLFEIADSYLATHPGDPFIQDERCGLFWIDEDWESAAGCYDQLLTQHPNWVIAQERLGSIALSQGRFEDSEQQFRTYLYIAPDQANPYDALGSLLSVRGRYEEAETLFRQGLEIKEDFCPLHEGLAWLYIFSGRFERAEETLEGMLKLETCADTRSHYACTMETLVHLLQDDRDSAREVADGGCLEANKGFYPAAHRLAVLDGRFEDAQRMEGYLRQRVAKHGKKYEMKGWQAILAHCEGVRLMFNGEFTQAAERLRAADEWLPFWGTQASIMKLFNRLNLAYALRASGAEQEAAAAYEEIYRVNPHFAGVGIEDLDRLIEPRQPSSEDPS